MRTADEMYGPIGRALEGLTLDPGTPPSPVLDGATAGATKRNQDAPSKAAQLADDPVFWLMVTIGLAVVAASYAATGRLPSIDIDL